MKYFVKLQLATRHGMSIRLLRTLALALIVLGLIGFVAIGNARRLLSSSPDQIELPVLCNAGVVADASGWTYCGSSDWSRVQLYTPDGQFVRAWFVETYGRPFRLAVNPQGELQVATHNWLGVFDREGHVLRTASSDAMPPSFNGPSPGLSPPRAAYFFPFTTTLHAWLTFMAGLVLLIATRACKGFAKWSRISFNVVRR